MVPATAPSLVPPQLNQIALDALRQDRDFRLAFEPTTFKELKEVAAIFAETGMWGIASANDAIVRMMAGRPLGLTLVQSMNLLYVIDNKPAMYAVLMHALILNSPLCEKFHPLETTEKKAVFVAKRKGGEDVKLEWTMEQAERAGLVNRGSDQKAKDMNNWNRYPTEMLRARCIAAMARLVFPDVIHGMHTVEELLDARVITLPPDAYSVVDVTPKKPAAVPERDFAKEAAELEQRIAKASKEELKPLREEIGAFEGGEHHGKLKDAYNKRVQDLKTPPAPKPEEQKQ
jgi:hypothetical protein